MTTQTSDDLGIPAFLRREDTPEEKAGRERQIKQSQRGGVRRVVRTGGRSTISNGHAANLDEVGKAILKEERSKQEAKKRERFARLRELRKERVMLQGPKQAALREKREQAAKTGKKPKASKVKAATEMVDLATKVAAAKAAFNGVSDVTDISMAELNMAPGAFLDGGGPVDTEQGPKTVRAQPKKARVTKAKPKNAPKATVKAPKAKGNGTKLALIVGLLTRKSGCTTKDILAATGWPSVSVPQQAKAAGLKLKKEKDGPVTRYHAA